ncbi:hypothetical protein P154DRAFT_572296 [Amniculicola lignicola CBS 123094]|uniref:Aminoglycoside phosphotransferase domain-containing protein n=1 Tax=Amniculicola lignicola CBS 123094 TaxID=1392246 RepID=A0A6A5WRE1_9PLEO|nr:hypothetical protein P154DRAFT_572296 [Amniculicola lignicola CBS 123094]
MESIEEIMIKHFRITDPIKAMLERSQAKRCLDGLSIKFPFQLPGTFNPPLPTAEDVLRTLAMYSRPLPVYHYIVMDYVKGQTMSKDLWSSLPGESKAIICSKLGSQLKEFRNLPQPGPDPYYGRVGEKGFASDNLMFMTDLKEINGPYLSYQALVDAMYKAAEAATALMLAQGWIKDVEPYIAELKVFKSTLLRCPPKGQRPTFTHLDLKIENIVVKQVNQSTDYDVTIIDWGSAGWLPAWTDVITLYMRPVSLLEDKTFFETRVGQELDPVDNTVVKFLKETSLPYFFV